MPSLNRTPRRAAAPVCGTLDVDDLCLPCELARVQPAGLRLQHRRVKRHAPLYREGDRFGAMYAVGAGSFKSVLHVASGAERVSGFHVGGEILGLDGLARDRHESTAIALEDSDIVVIPYGELRAFTQSVPLAHDLLPRLLSREVVRERSHLRILARHGAEERLCAFLMDFSERMLARGFSGTEFHLRLTREELGSYLGLKLETVSRAFGRLQQQRLLTVQGRHVRLLDLHALERVGLPH